MKTRSKLFLLFLLLMRMASVGRAQSFADFVARIEAAPDSARTALIDRFMKAVPRFPFTETDSTVHFIYRGPASTEAVPGDANGWNPRRAAMQRLANTDLGCRSETFMPVARLDYKFILNNLIWLCDPRNPYTVDLRFFAVLYGKMAGASGSFGAAPIPMGLSASNGVAAMARAGPCLRECMGI